MNVDTTRLLRHMSWANRLVFDATQTLPDEALTSYLINPDFNVARLLQHIVEGAEWYAFCLCGEPMRPRRRPSSARDVAALAEELRSLESIILREADGEDVALRFEDEDGSHSALRSTIISQAVHHATEHRTQLVDALELRGYRPISLDDIDLWALEFSERS